jgi:putative membrane protein
LMVDFARTERTPSREINSQLFRRRNIMIKPILLTFTCAALAATIAFAAQEKSAAPPTDPQIAMIAVTADTIDIDAGKLAAEKTTNPKVKDFAELMVRDHTSVNNQATQLAKKLNLTPEASATSRSLKSEGDKMMTKLKGLTGAAFDKAYIDNEVSYHESVIKAVNDTLIPNAKNAELKSLLESAGPVFSSHLNHAKEIQASLK